MFKEDITNFVKKKAAEQTSAIVENATQEVKAQYKFALFMAKAYLVLAALFGLTIVGIAGYGLYSLVS